MQSTPKEMITEPISIDSENLQVVDAIQDDRIRFTDLGLPAQICAALESSGYEYPTPIQAATIPAIAAGKDVLGQAQTGTGKTAAFALPLLTKIDVDNPATQVLVLTPTRELAIQVSESFERYGQHLQGLRVCPIYGGAAYATQIHALRRGVQIVVGTPGRVMDHMRENRLRIDTLRCLVLDEADEMLRMGFAEDVQWILGQAPANRQMALFSATMPQAIREIADRYLQSPHIVTLDLKQKTAETIRQRFVMVEPRSRFEAMVRILEAEEIDGMIIFVKTKMATVELADNLTQIGHPAVALNGDIPQLQRERIVEQLKQGVFNVLVATDVAARGLDVQRISHVVNYDLPMDAEAYVHRIGRTGRAGRSGEAIVFISPRQRGFLREIDRAAGHLIQPMSVPTAREINLMRTERFKSKLIKKCVENQTPSAQFQLFHGLIEQCIQDSGLPADQLAAALALLMQGEKPFLVEDTTKHSARRGVFESQPERTAETERARTHADDPRGKRKKSRDSETPRRRDSKVSDFQPSPDGSMERFRIEVGRSHGVRPGNIVGAIANESGLESSFIGSITIHDDFSTVDLPVGMPDEIFQVLNRTWVVGRQLRISKWNDRSNHRSFRGKKSRATN